MIVKLIVAAILLGIITSLGMALFYMIKDRGSTTRTARALTVRVGVSIGLFLLLLLLSAIGVITPHGIIP